MPPNSSDPSETNSNANSADISENSLEKSKSQRKREMTELQQLGEKLTELNDEQLARFPLSESLSEAIREYRRMTKNEAKRRQRQYIGKLMRSEDLEGIIHHYEKILEHASRQQFLLQQAEQWRERLLSEQDTHSTTLQEFLTRYQDADRQAIRSLLRQAEKEKINNKPPTAARKLFRLLRDTIYNESLQSEPIEDDPFQSSPHKDD